jgi:hypothetical protein
MAVLGSFVWFAPRTAYAEPGAVVLVRTWQVPEVLDQGSTPMCVGYAWSAWVQSEPSPNRQWFDPAKLYREAQYIDVWPGEDYAGTSAEAGAAVLGRYGRLHAYGVSWDYEAIRRFMLERGPVVLATPWLGGMMQTNRNGYVTARGAIWGYHAVECYDIRGGSVGCQNSWGTDWGDGGRFRISRPDFERLLDMGGYAVLATFPPPVADVFSALRVN